jgi:chromosome partitioning protein
MALVLTVAQQKGGVGKTTLAANLAAAYAATASVALLDIDPQRSLTRWHTLRQEAKAAGSPYPRITFSDVSGWRLPAELDRLRRNHEVVLIDSPPHIDTDARVAVRAADLVLIPLQPSPPDLWAAEGTLKLAAAEQRRAVLVFNRAPAASRLRSTIQDEIATRHLTLLQSALGNRIGFATAFAEGLGVTEAAPRSLAATELRALLANLKDLMK